MNTHRAKLKFGKYKGKLFTRVPVGYLTWLFAGGVTGPVELHGGEIVKAHEAAEAELLRRGKRVDVEVSGHAIDRISWHGMDAWRSTRKPNEGLFTWAQRMTLEALDSRKAEGKGLPESEGLRINWNGLIWVVRTDQLVPVLKTVIDKGTA